MKLLTSVYSIRLKNIWVDKISLKTFTSNSRKQSWYKFVITNLCVNSLLITHEGMQTWIWNLATTNGFNFQIEINSLMAYWSTSILVYYIIDHMTHSNTFFFVKIFAERCFCCELWSYHRCCSSSSCWYSSQPWLHPYCFSGSCAADECRQRSC